MAETATGDFDEAFYLGSNPDVAAAVARGQFRSGLHHWNEFGAREGRFARPLAKRPPSEIAKQPSELSDSGGSIPSVVSRHPQLQFRSDRLDDLKSGKVVPPITSAEVSSANLLVEPYLGCEASVGRPNWVKALGGRLTKAIALVVSRVKFRQNVANRRREAMRGNTELEFDATFYLVMYPDVAKDVREGKWKAAIDHWHEFGRKEGRRPNPATLGSMPTTVSESAYLRVNRDVLVAVEEGRLSSGLDHFLETGWKEVAAGMRGTNELQSVEALGRFTLRDRIFSILNNERSKSDDFVRDEVAAWADSLMRRDWPLDK